MGLESVTSCVINKCSDQLNYGTIWQAVLISRNESLRLPSFACFPKENIPRRYQSFTEFHFLFATNTLKSINKYPTKGLAMEVGFEPTGGSSPPLVFKTSAINQTLPLHHIELPTRFKLVYTDLQSI